MEHLIPKEPFEHLPQLVLILIVLGAIYFLIKGADHLVDGASSIALKFGMPKVIVGATIVSLGTTSPEAAVSVMAAWSGEPGLALGNAIGSIIADTGLIFGVGCLMTVLPADRFVLTRQGWVQFGSGVLLALIVYISFAAKGEAASLGRVVGAVLLGLLVLYMFVSVRWSKQHRFGEPFQVPDDMAGGTAPGVMPETPEVAKREWVIKDVGGMVLGLLLVVVGSQFLVNCVSVLAERWGVPKTVVAATLVALGTSLPELVVGVTAIRKGHKELLVGNVIGADILNVLFVVGASAVAADLPVVEHAGSMPRVLLYLHLPAMLLILFLFRGFIFAARRKQRFQRWMGVPLVLCYVAYVTLAYVLTT